VDQSPIDQLLEAIDKLDVDAATALMAPECRFLALDGRRTEGIAAARALLTDFFSEVRSTTHRVTAQWHQDDVWIAEVEADYELKDWERLTGLARALVLRTASDGVSELHSYGAHEQRFPDESPDDGGLWFGGHWMPPL
jgi:hypothetical protein